MNGIGGFDFINSLSSSYGVSSGISSGYGCYNTSSYVNSIFSACAAINDIQNTNCFVQKQNKMLDLITSICPALGMFMNNGSGFNMTGMFGGMSGGMLGNFFGGLFN